MFPEEEITPVKAFSYAGEEPSSSLRSRKVDQEPEPQSLISHVGLLLRAVFCVTQCKLGSLL